TCGFVRSNFCFDIFVFLPYAGRVRLFQTFAAKGMTFSTPYAMVSKSYFAHPVASVEWAKSMGIAKKTGRYHR
ncbi:MAG: hypothetical protein ACOCTS_04085, partial [Thermodesulfobacteriota bacterium]